MSQTAKAAPAGFQMPVITEIAGEPVFFERPLTR